MKVAIHQTDFFPWLGFFNKYANSDRFVIHDYGQHPKGISDYTSRVKIIQAGEASWIKIPLVQSYHGFRTYAEMEIDEQKPWRRKTLQAIQLNYAKHPHYKDLFPLIEPLLLNPTHSLLEFNLNILKTLISLLELDLSKLIMGSALPHTQQVKTGMLIELVSLAGGDTYLSGTGGSEYQDEQAIRDAGLQIQYNRYPAPPYPQKGLLQFVPGLSVIDALMNCGISETRKMILT